MNAPIRIKDPNASGRQYNFSFGFGGMAALITGFTLALSLFFVLGVLVGRGHRPETAVPVVANIMPRETVPAPVAQAVLKPEELNYPDQLAKKTEAAPSRPIDKQEHKATPPAEKKSDKKEDPKARKAEDKGKDKAAAKKPEQKPDPDTQRYDYAYQVATFGDMDQAKAFLKRVKSAGVKGDIESGTTNGKQWHRVVVFFQGTPTDTRALKDKLNGMGAQKPVMRSKTPI